ncbi:MAG: DUF3489 domain-containing protein [Pseudomonadota bacterium]
MAQSPPKHPVTTGSTTKRAVVIKLLQRKSGATLTDITERTGWQAHTARGFLSGVVRKKLGLPIETEVMKSGRTRYFLRSVS